MMKMGRLKFELNKNIYFLSKYQVYLILNYFFLLLSQKYSRKIKKIKFSFCLIH